MVLQFKSKKQTLVLIVIIVLILTVFLIIFNKNKNSWSVYQNSRYNFKVNYPADWTLGEEETNNAGREFFSPDKTVVCYAYGFPNALEGKSGNFQTLDEFIDWLTGDDKSGSQDENYALVLEKNKATLDKIEAVHLYLEEDMNKKDAIYTLDKETGIGLFCNYGRDSTTREKYKNVFDQMVQSFQIMADSRAQSGETKILACDALLQNNVAPLKDFQTFTDNRYTEVVITTRENWDKNKLPAKVIGLQGKKYQCYPMPFEQEEGKQTAGMNTQPEVKSVQWTCELKYADYKYLGLDKTAEKDKLSGNNYQCKEETCTDGDNDKSSVWLCTK